VTIETPTLKAKEITMQDPTTTVSEVDENSGETDEIVEDLLVEEVSIDGMCGVY
jgi:mycofactocin precursor